MSGARRPQEVVRGLFRTGEDPYEGASLEASRRIVAAVLGLTSLLTVAFLPVEPVNEQIGWAGWSIAGGLVGASLAGTVLMIRASPSFNDLLGVAYAGIAGIAVLNWLAAGGSSAYEDLYVLWLGAASVHPPRRAFAVLAAMLALLALPLIYEGTDAELVGDMVGEALLLVVVGLILIAYQQFVRRERAGLQAGAEVARRLAGVDALTGLGNRRAFDEALTAEAAGSARDQRPLSIGLLDVIGLKRINDRFGHLEGDRCLRDIARTVESSIRSSDRCFRWGGDEFVVMLPGSDRGTAEEVLRRMTANVTETCKAPDGSGLALTFATAEMAAGAGPEEVLAAADVALLERKTEQRR